MSQQVLDGVRDLLPTIRSRAEEAERLRVVPDASIKELEETGFYRLLQPKRYGGFESDPVDFYTGIKEVAGDCGSTGWVSSVVGVHPWQVALFADEAQQAVWGSDQDTRLSSSYAPTGKAQLTDGGFTLSGRWSFSSGCDHCQWVLLGGLVFNAEGQVVDFRTFMVPRSDYTIEEVWNTVGLRAPAPTTSSSRTCSCPRPSRCRCRTPVAASAPARRSTPRTSTSCRSTRSSR